MSENTKKVTETDMVPKERSTLGVDYFERLIAQQMEGEEGEAVEQTLSGGGYISETAYVGPSLRGLPNVGVRLETGETTAYYDVNFYRGLREGERIQVGEPHFSAYSQGRGVSFPTHMVEGGSIVLDESLGRNIIQAMSNVSGEPILHSLEINIFDRNRVSELSSKGYVPRRGYPQVYDKFFTPQDNKED